MKNPWILAIRPKTLSISLAPVLLGTSIAHFSMDFISWKLFSLTLLAAIFLQIATNLFNDSEDSAQGIDGPARLGPTRVVESGLLPLKKVRMAGFGALFIALLLGFAIAYLTNYKILILGIICMLFAYLYTGGPFPLSYFALGEFFAFLFFGPIATGGTFFIQTGTIDSLSIIVGFGPGLIAALILGINNLRDLHTDKETKKKTIAILLGENKMRFFLLFLGVLSSYIPLYIYFQLRILYFAAPVVLFYLFIGIWRDLIYIPISPKLNETLALTAKYCLIYCILFSIGFIV